MNVAGDRPGSRLRQRLTTRVLLTCAVFAAVQVLLYFAVAPFTATLAAVFPPAYAVLAGLHSLMPFTARRFTGQHGTATLTAMLTGLLVAAVSPIGFLVLVPLTVAAAAFDLAYLVLGSRRRLSPAVLSVVAAISSAIALFAVSLPVFSAEHLIVGLLAATLIGRIGGQLAAALCATGLVGLLVRAGLRPAPASSPSPRRQLHAMDAELTRK